MNIIGNIFVGGIAAVLSVSALAQEAKKLGPESRYVTPAARIKAGPGSGEAQPRPAEASKPGKTDEKKEAMSDSDSVPYLTFDGAENAPQ